MYISAVEDANSRIMTAGCHAVTICETFWRGAHIENKSANSYILKELDRIRSHRPLS